MNTQRDNFPVPVLVNSRNEYENGKARESTTQRVGFPADSRGGETLSIPADAEESLSAWYDEVERNHIQEERDREREAWAQQERLQAATDDTGDEFYETKH